MKWTDSTDSTKTFSAGDFDVITVPHNDQTGKATKTYIATTETGYTFKEETASTAAITGKLNDAANTALTDTQLTSTKENDKKYTVNVTVPAYGTTYSGTNGYNSVALTGSTGVSCGVTLKTHEGGETMNQGKTYDGKAVAYQQGQVEGAALSYTWQKKENASDPTSNYQDMATGTVPTDAGEYNLKVEAKKGSNVIGTQNLPFTISAKQVTANVTVADKTYDGNNTATITKVELTGVEEADKTKVSLSTDGVTATFNDVEAGNSKDVTVEGLAQKTLTGEKAQNYALTQNYTTNKPSITKADGSGFVTLDNWIYGNTASTPTVTSTTNGTDSVAYRYKAKDAADTEYTDKVPTKAGEYTVQATFAETTNYKEATATADFEIYKKALLVQVSALDKVYDGTTEAKLSTAKLEEGSVLDGDEVTLVTTGVTALFDTAEVGTKKNVTLKGDYTLTGADAADYTVSKPRSLSADITQAEGKGTVSLSGWTYGDTPKTPGVTSTTNGTKGVTYRYKVKGASTYLTGVPTDAGEYEVEAIFPASDNYKAVTATATFTIQPKALTVTVTAQDKTYDGNNTATLNTPTLNGVLEADKTAVTLNTTNVKAVFADKNVGDNKAITVTGYALNGNEKGNYTLTQPTGLTASIKSKPSSSSSSGSSSSSSSSADTAVTSAHTADESPIVLWLALLLISAGACAVVLGKKKYHK